MDKGGMLCLTLFAMLAACKSLPQSVGSDVPPELIEEIRDYLKAPSEDEDRLVQPLMEQPVTQLEAGLLLVLNGSFDGSVPTGKLPDQSIQVGENEMRYGLYVPLTYTPSRSYPLVICLHGAGFDGDSYLSRWQPRLGEDYLLACPSIDLGAWWTREGEELVLAVLSEVSRRYRVDTDRIFLTGMSNGGIGTYLIGLNHPDRFAALVPMAAALPPALFPLLENAKNLPFYIIHGAQDQVMPVQYSREVVDYLKNKGQSVVYREHERVHPMAGGHFFPGEELPDLLRWLEGQSRKPIPRELVVVRDRDHLGRTDWVRIEEVEPDVGSFWTSEHDPEESHRLQQGRYARLMAKIVDQTFFVTTERIARFSLLLNRDLVDFDRPTRVVVNGQEKFNGAVKPDARTLLEEARKRPDPHQRVLASVQITVSH